MRHRSTPLLFAAAFGVAGCSRGLDRLEASEIDAVPGIGDVAVTWLGTAGARIDDGQTALLIDPFVTRPGVGRFVFGAKLRPDEGELRGRVDTSRVAAVLVTHSHFDHLMDAPWLANETAADLVGSASTIAVGRASGLPKGQLHVAVMGEPIDYGAFTVTFLESRHGKVLAGKVPYDGVIPADVKLPLRGRQYKMGGAVGIVVEHPAGTFVHHASAAWVEGMYDGVEADVVMLGLAGHDDPTEYVEHVVDQTGAQRVIPIHWDNFFRGLHRPLRPLGAAHVNRFYETVDGPAHRVQSLPILEERRLLERRE